jgi:hypothetical protein
LGRKREGVRSQALRDGPSALFPGRERCPPQAHDERSRGTCLASSGRCQWRSVADHDRGRTSAGCGGWMAGGRRALERVEDRGRARGRQGSLQRRRARPGDRKHVLGRWAFRSGRDVAGPHASTPGCMIPPPQRTRMTRSPPFPSPPCSDRLVLHTSLPHPSSYRPRPFPPAARQQETSRPQADGLTSRFGQQRNRAI